MALPEPVNTLKLNVYPNPTQNIVYLEMPIPSAEVVVSISDIQGRVLMSQKMSPSMFVAPVPMDIQHLAEGTYILSLYSREGMSVKKIVVQH